MKIAVIGAGRIGATVGGRWAAAGHEVVYGLRDPSKKPGAKAAGESLDGAEAVLIAVPAAALPDVAHVHAKQLAGKILIDATNDFGGQTFHQWPMLSATVPNAQLYRAFNTLGWDVFANPMIGGQKPDLFYAGPEGAGKERVEKLIEDVGLRPVWVGGPAAVDTVDGVLRLWAALSRMHGRHMAFRMLED